MRVSLKKIIMGRAWEKKRDTVWILKGKEQRGPLTSMGLFPSQFPQNHAFLSTLNSLAQALIIPYMVLCLFLFHLSYIMNTLMF